jgi:hypothetical protein
MNIIENNSKYNEDDDDKRMIAKERDYCDDKCQTCPFCILKLLIFSKKWQHSHDHTQTIQFLIYSFPLCCWLMLGATTMALHLIAS